MPYKLADRTATIEYQSVLYNLLPHIAWVLPNGQIIIIALIRSRWEFEVIVGLTIISRLNRFPYFHTCELSFIFSTSSDLRVPVNWNEATSIRIERNFREPSQSVVAHLESKKEKNRHFNMGIGRYLISSFHLKFQKHQVNSAATWTENVTFFLHLSLLNLAKMHLFIALIQTVKWKLSNEHNYLFCIRMRYSRNANDITMLYAAIIKLSNAFTFGNTTKTGFCNLRPLTA